MKLDNDELILLREIVGVIILCLCLVIYKIYKDDEDDETEE